MKKSLHLRAIALFALSVVCFLPLMNLFAGDIHTGGVSSNGLQMVENTYSALKLQNTLTDLNYFTVKTKAGNFTLLKADGYGFSNSEGDPQLPVLKQLIEIPLGAVVTIQVLSSSYKELDLADYGISDLLMPAQPPLSKSITNPDDVQFIWNKTTYGMDQYLGNDLVTVEDQGMMRGVRLGLLEVSPVQYNPVKGKIRVYESMEVEIGFSCASVVQTIETKKHFFSPFYEAIYSSVMNYKPLNGDELIMDEPATYVIVSDPMFQAALQPFIQWKIKKGFAIIEAYTNDPNVGTTTTTIKNYLKNLYLTPPAGFNAPSFILLVGDVAQIPAFSGSGGHVTDLYYAEYTNDILPELYYGRFSANNLNELQPQIDKTLEYEQYLMPDPSFLDEVVMVAGEDGTHQLTWGNGQINYGTTYYFNLAHGLTSHTYLQPEPSGQNYSQMIKQNVSDGVGYANYTAHGSPSGWAAPSFVISDIANLQNAHKYPLMVGNCCSTSEYQTTCFAEAVLRAQNKGALGYIGGSNSTYWDEDYWWGVGFKSISANPTYDPTKLGGYDRTFHDQGEPLAEWYVTQGQMVQGGNMAVQQSNSGMKTYYWEIYCLMGDPSLMVYYSQPPDITANYQALMPLASTTFTVNTDPYAYVAISKDGVLYGAAVADNAGLAEVTLIPITVPGTADIVITKQNGKPFIGTVQVASPNGPYILFDALTLDDSQGNNNGLADYSEEIYFDVTLENLGSQTGSNLVATLSTTNQYVTILDNTQNWPNIPAGSNLLQDNAFEVKLDNILPDQEVAQFTLQVTNGTDTWTSNFNVTLNAPVLSVGSLTIDDAAGNNNGQLDPGETVNLILANINDGHSDAPGTTATISSGSGLITINSSSYNVGMLAAGATANAVFSISVSPTAQTGDLVNIDYLVQSGGYSATKALSLTVGLIIEDFETGDFTAFDWEFAGNANWVINQTVPYEGIYCAESGNISDQQSTTLLITLTVTMADQISFYRKVSSEADYDYLRFYIDNTMKEEWSGEADWDQVSYAVTAGEHTFKWEYSKDYSVSNGSDAGYVDYIVFPPCASGPMPLGVTASASPNAICQSSSSQLMALASGGTGTYSYSWLPTTGLNNPNIYNPTASPAATTTYTVAVNDGSNTVTASVLLTVHPKPATPTITQQGNSLVSSSATGNQWYNSTGAIAGATAQIYLPMATEDYYVIVTNQYSCASDPSNVIHFTYTGLAENKNGEKVNIYPNPFTSVLNIDYELARVSDIRISILDSYGQEIALLADLRDQASGPHRIIFQAQDLTAGIYYCRIQTSDFTSFRKIVLAR